MLPVVTVLPISVLSPYTISSICLGMKARQTAAVLPPWTTNFSQPEQNEQAGDSDTRVGSAPEDTIDKLPGQLMVSAEGVEGIPLPLSDFEQNSCLESGDWSDRDVRKRRREPEPDNLNTRGPSSLSDPKEGDHALGDGDSQHDGGRARRRRRHPEFNRERQRDNSLFGFLTDNDDGNVNDRSDLSSRRAKRRRRSSSLSSSFDASPQSSRFTASPGMTVLPTPRSVRTVGFTLIDRSSRSDPTRMDATLERQELDKMPQSNPNQNGVYNTDDDDGKPEDELVWLYGPLLSCKVVNGKPLVLVPWYPIWESPDEYSKEEVERVKRQYESPALRKGRGRPPSKGNRQFT